jgi:hypothetical protein
MILPFLLRHMAITTGISYWTRVESLFLLTAETAVAGHRETSL